MIMRMLLSTSVAIIALAACTTTEAAAPAAPAAPAMVAATPAPSPPPPPPPPAPNSQAFARVIDLGQGVSMLMGQGGNLGLSVGEDGVFLIDDQYATNATVNLAKIEELVSELTQDYTIVIVTHNMQQAARVSDYTAYMYLGELIEFDTTDTIFIKPKNQATEDYITGRFG